MKIRAQSISEYVVLLALIASVLIGMQVYVRRGLQARLKETADFAIESISQGLEANYASQYEPEYRTNTKDTRQRILLQENASLGGRREKNYLEDTTQVTQTEVIR